MPIDLKMLKVGETFKDNFIVLLKEKKFTKTGKPFGDLLLGYKNGEIAAKIWDLTDELYESFDKKTVVEITGRLDEFMGRPQIIVSSINAIEPTKINYKDFLPAGKYSTDELKSQLFTMIETISDSYLKILLNRVFSDTYSSVQNLTAFLTAPAAKNFHHAYLGGLAEHTIGVAKLCDTIAVNYADQVNRDLLVTGALLHDIGKTREFSYLKTIDYSTEGRLIGHHVLGYDIIKQAADSIDNETLSDTDIVDSIPDKVSNVTSSEAIMQLQHLILSHHGSYENQSPKKPKTIEALLLHVCDDADAKINAFQTISEKVEDGSSWSPYNKVLERFVYLKKLNDDEKIEDIPFEFDRL